MSSPMDYLMMGVYDQQTESSKPKEEKKRKHTCGPIMITPELIKALRRQFGIEVYKSDGTLA